MTTPIKVICLNIWHGGRLLENALNFIAHESPDLLLMQEVYNHHDQSLEPRFHTVDLFMDKFDFVDHDFAPTMTQLLPEGQVEQGNAIFSKFPIIGRQAPIFFNQPYSNNYVDIPKNFPTAPRNLQHYCRRRGRCTGRRLQFSRCMGSRW